MSDIVEELWRIRLSELDNQQLLSAIRIFEDQNQEDSDACQRMHAEARKRGIWSRDK